MSQHSDRLTDELITRFLRTRSADPDAGLMDQILAAVQTTPQERPWLGLRPIVFPRRTVLIVAITMLLATMGAIAVGSRLVQPEVPLEQRTLIREVIDAANSRDVAALRSALAADGLLEFPQVNSSAGNEGEVFMSGWRVDLAGFPGAWIDSLDTWRMAAELGSCRTRSESTVSCEVVTRWHVLQVEIGEEWTFDFDGTHVTRLRMARVDPDPPNRVLPLGLDDLARWEGWLRETHPEQVDALLPTGPDLFGHFYFRFALDADPDEIGASIREYVGSRP